MPVSEETSTHGTGDREMSSFNASISRIRASWNGRYSAGSFWSYRMLEASRVTHSRMTPSTCSSRPDACTVAATLRGHSSVGHSCGRRSRCLRMRYSREPEPDQTSAVATYRIFFPNPEAIFSEYWLLPLLVPPTTSVMRGLEVSVFGDMALIGFQYGLVGVQEVIQTEYFQRDEGGEADVPHGVEQGVQHGGGHVV